MLGIIVIAAGLALTFWYFFVRTLNYWSKLGVKQGKPWIFFGDTWYTVLRLASFNDFVSIIYNMHPGSRYSGVYKFSSPVLVLKDPELIKQLAVKNFEHFPDHAPFVDPDADPLWSKALLSLRGERWKQMRSTLSPTFTSSKIKSIYTLKLETVDNFVKHFLEMDDEIIEVEMKDACSRVPQGLKSGGIKSGNFTNLALLDFYLYSTLISIMYKTPINTSVELENQIHQAFYARRITTERLLRIPFLDKTASRYFYAIIDETIKVREEQNIVRPDMIHLMLEARKDKVEHIVFSDTGKSKGGLRISNEEITSQAMIFFVAGFDTVSTTMCFGLYELALEKDIQDRLREEIMETQKDRKVTYDALMQMKYMDMVVSEILRKWPPLPSLDRICTKPYTIEPSNEDEKPVPIQVNQEIWLPIYGIQKDPKWFPNPDKFDPERFSDENKNNIVPYTYMPFGVGPRTCIGNRFALVEVKAMLFNLLLHFEIVPTNNTQIPLVLGKDFSQIPDGGLLLGLKRIK